MGDVRMKWWGGERRSLRGCWAVPKGHIPPAIMVNHGDYYDEKNDSNSDTRMDPGRMRAKRDLDVDTDFDTDADNDANNDANNDSLSEAYKNTDNVTDIDADTTGNNHRYDIQHPERSRSWPR